MKSNFILCPNCKEKNNPTFSKCWKCGVSLDANLVGEFQFNQAHSTDRMDDKMMKMLKQKYATLSDDELSRIVYVESSDYRAETIAIAKEELEKRGIHSIDQGKIGALKDQANLEAAVAKSVLPKFVTKLSEKMSLATDNKNLPIQWLNFYTYFRLPVGIGVGLLRSFFMGRAEMLINLPWFGFGAFVFLGLYKKRLWGWKANFALLALEPIVFALNRGHDTPSFIYTFMGAIICWTIPNVIYFEKRRYLFS